MASIYCVIESGLWEENGGEFEEEGSFLGSFSSEAGARARMEGVILEKRRAGARGRYRYLAFMSALDAPARMDSYFVWSYHTLSAAEPRPFEVRYEYDPEFLAENVAEAAIAPERAPSVPQLELTPARECAGAPPI